MAVWHASLGTHVSLPHAVFHFTQLWALCWFDALLGTKPRATPMLGKCSPSQLHPPPPSVFRSEETEQSASPNTYCIPQRQSPQECGLTPSDQAVEKESMAAAVSEERDHGSYLVMSCLLASP